MTQAEIAKLPTAQLIELIEEIDAELGDCDDNSAQEDHFASLLFDLEFELEVNRGISSPV